MNPIRFPHAGLAGGVLALALAATLPVLAHAHDGHEHGQAAPAAAPAPRLADLAPRPAAGLAEAKTATTIGRYGGTRMMQLQLKAGTSMPAHSAPERVLVVVLSGRGSFGLGADRVALHERQVLHLAPGEEHSVQAETDLELLLVRIGEGPAVP